MPPAPSCPGPAVAPLLLDELLEAPGGGLLPRRAARDLTAELAAEPARRRRLWDITGHLHCSIIGTCLTLGELRALARRLVKPPACDPANASDHELHEMVVQLARRHDAPGKLLQKCLDQKYAGTIRRFADASAAGQVEALWCAAVQSGDIPGAYWAVLTHPLTGDPLLRRAVGEVHMLSHLVGASNRADLRRLHELEHDGARLRDELAGARSAQRTRLAERDARVHELEGELAARSSELARARETAAVRRSGEDDPRLDLEAELERERLARQRAEDRLAEMAEEATAARQRLAEVEALQVQSRREIRALERRLGELLEVDEAASCKSASWLDGRRVLLAGARAAQVGAARTFVERPYGVFLHHDGGIDDNIATLPGLVSRADHIVVPMACVSHEAVRLVKRATAQLGKAWQPLHSASLAALAHSLDAIDGRSHGAPQDRTAMLPSVAR